MQTDPGLMEAGFGPWQGLTITEIEAGWPDGILTSQRDWIGRSYGADVEFQVAGSDERITVFTTRIDTIFGVTAVMLAPEHPLVAALVESSDRREAIQTEIASMIAEHC